MRKIIFLIIGIGLIGAIGYGIAVKIQNSAPENKSKRTNAKPGSGIAIPIETVTVKTEEIRNVRTFTGTLEPWSQYEVAPKIAGRLESLDVEIGDPVNNGQLLATIDDDEYLQEIEKAKADLGISEALKSELLTNLNLAQLEYERAKNMIKNKVISDSTYESKRSDFLVKVASLKKAQAELEQKKAILNLAKVRYDYTKIYARWGRKNFFFSLKSPEKDRNTIEKFLNAALMHPGQGNLKTIDVKELASGEFLVELELLNPVFNYDELVPGFTKIIERVASRLPAGTTVKYLNLSAVRYIGKKYFDAGQMLKANDAILTIVNIRRMKAMVNVIEKDYPLLKKGQDASVTTDAYPGKTFAGKVRNITKVLDEYTRQAQVEIEIDNSQLLLRPGMFVKVSVEFATIRDAQVVPRNAVVNFNEVTGVFMLTSDNKTVNFIPVQTGLSCGDKIQIVSPRLVRPIVTLGNHLLYNGVAIKITSRDEVVKDIIGTEKNTKTAKCFEDPKHHESQQPQVSAKAGK
ncbi:MAG: efflux RND transporter periplasmic adaptor subunit [Victivallales bacterium]|nr:efflux RND transporter periplasmic adaptor subunit [Victivallales bacterium]